MTGQFINTILYAVVIRHRTWNITVGKKIFQIFDAITAGRWKTSITIGTDRRRASASSTTSSVSSSPDVTIIVISGVVEWPVWVLNFAMSVGGGTSVVVGSGGCKINQDVLLNERSLLFGNSHPRRRLCGAFRRRMTLMISSSLSTRRFRGIIFQNLF